MLTYLDSSVLGRAYLADEPGHGDAVTLLEDPETVLVTATLTRVEVTGLLTRAARVGRCRIAPLLSALQADLGPDGAVTPLVWPQDELEQVALAIVTEHGIRALDALHLAVAQLAVRALAGGDPVGFATRDAEQAAVASASGLTLR